MNDDKLLIEKALKGESAAFGQLVRRYQDRLYSSVVHVVADAEEAEDIVQDAFIQALRKLDAFRGKSSFYTWLYRIAFNTAINRQRRRRPEVSIEHARETAGADPPDPIEQPGERLMREERAQHIQQALASISEEYRAVLVLREIEGFDYETIAGVLDVSVGTIRSRLHRARSLMREQLRRIQIDSTSD